MREVRDEYWRGRFSAFADDTQTRIGLEWKLKTLVASLEMFHCFENNDDSAVDEKHRHVVLHRWAEQFGSVTALVSRWSHPGWLFDW